MRSALVASKGQRVALAQITRIPCRRAHQRGWPSTMSVYSFSLSKTILHAPVREGLGRRTYLIYWAHQRGRSCNMANVSTYSPKDLLGRTREGKYLTSSHGNSSSSAKVKESSYLPKHD